MSRRPATASSPNKSPKKSKTLAGPQLTSADYENLLGDQRHQMSMEVSEKEIEIERLKTTVTALNGKVVIVEDHRLDAENARADFKDSEGNRVQLQEHIVQTSETVRVDNVAHKTY